MYNKLSILLAILLVYCQYCYPQNSVGFKDGKIVICGKFSSDFYKHQTANFSLKDSQEIEFRSLTDVGFHLPWKSAKVKLLNNEVKWIVYSVTPVQMESDLGYLPIVSPGDSICITYNEQGPVYSGTGADKLTLWQKLIEIRKKIVKPTPKDYIINTLEDYLKWNWYSDKNLRLLLPVIEGYKEKMLPFEYDYVKSYMVQAIESSRTSAFSSLAQKVLSDTSCRLSTTNLAAIWDSTQFKPWANWLRALSVYYGPIDGFVNFTYTEAWRKFEFSYAHDGINTNEKRRLIHYNSAKLKYKGLVRERILASILTSGVNELGADNLIKSTIYTDYYNEEGFPEFKAWVRGKDLKSRLFNDNGSPDFELEDINGNSFTKEDIKGKIALLDFWFTGCQPCIGMKQELQKIKNIFKNDPIVSFVSISTDSDKKTWLKSITEDRYSTKQAINLYTGGQGKNHAMMQNYAVSVYPELHLLNAEGKIITFPVPDPRTEKGRKELIAMIKQEVMKKKELNHASLNDGPYLSYKNDSMFITYLSPLNETTSVHTEIKKKDERGGLSLTVQTDIPTVNFSVQLKNSLQHEPSEFENVTRQLALSDIEGNFDSFRKLLQSNGVIDERFNWIFGTGHLVLNGDFFDRGNQVTEVLWLIYSLEEKAKKAGGYVHFILGNHEIMNLENDTLYLNDKYKKNVKLMGNEYASLYDENSELGRWLRTKNIIEKIGGVLYTHGGISPDVNRLKVNLTIPEINSLARNYYGKPLDSANTQLLILFDKERVPHVRDRISPFWFRGYYESFDHPERIPTMEQVDSTLQNFNVTKIVTGHTIIYPGDKITSHYKAKIINTDTRHAEGKSEALLIEGNKFYRVNIDGVKELLLQN